MPPKKFAISFGLFNKGCYFSWYDVINHQALLDIAEKTRCRYPYNVPTQIIHFVKNRVGSISYLSNRLLGRCFDRVLE